jgi:hypothetical protein
MGHVVSMGEMRHAYNILVGKPEGNRPHGKPIRNFLTKHNAMKTYWGVEVQLHAFFDLGTRWRRVVSFMPRERTRGTHWIGGWVGPRAGLDAVMKRN